MATDDKFEFQPDEDGTLDIKSAVFQALGAVSMCWDETPKGVFESTRAKEIGEALISKIDDEYEGRAFLGHATTQQLLEELTVRIETDYYVGGGGLQYSTVKGRPEGLNDRVTIHSTPTSEEPTDRGN